jgi:general secretion pathway protein G
MRHRRHTDRRAGFTIVELAIVLTIIFIICAIAVPGYRFILLHAREQTLRDDLRSMRKMIDQYSADKQKAPHSLDDLVAEKYLPNIPEDPMTGSASTWVTIDEEDPLSLKGDTGIVDVKSGSDEVDSTGEHRYSEW